MSGGLTAIEISDQGITKAPRLLGHRALEATAGGIENHKNLAQTQFETNKLRLVGLLDLFLGGI
ncbi:MAG: hypothetical protein ACFFEK_01970 [Candidatus Thorarchaeota archaeon]